MAGRLPNFLYIGPDKTGSTWMYDVLRAHPRAFVPPVKDVYFFDRYYDRGIEWYAGFFRSARPDAIAVGELSHDYLFSRRAAERIAGDLPGVRLFTSVRNPVDRTFSHYLFLVRSGLTLGFDDALARIPELIDKSRYHTHLRPWFERFPAAQLRVFLFDDLVADERAFAHDMLDYLGLDPDELPTLPRASLPASRPRSALLARTMKRAANFARDAGLTSLVGVVKRSVLRELLYARYRAGEKPQLTDAQRERLWQTFEPEVIALESLIGRSLAHWRPDALGATAAVAEVSER